MTDVFRRSFLGRVRLVPSVARAHYRIMRKGGAPRSSAICVVYGAIKVLLWC